MQSMFNPGDRVRSKQTGRLGTVVAVVDVGGVGGFATGPLSSEQLVRVEWDGREGSPGPACVDEIHAIRPPPAPWPAPAW